MSLEVARVSAQHERINELYAELRSALVRGVSAHVSICFARLRDVLHAHFEVEDRIYFPMVRSFRPQRAVLLERLEAEHEDFRRLLAHIDESVLGEDVAATREGLALLVGRLLRHEEAEAELLRELAKGAAREGPEG